MEKNKKQVRKIFLAHQYEKEEVFLSKMAREGWHFVQLKKGLPSCYVFEKGDPIDYVYQLDFITKEEDTEDYHQLFKDAGWDEVFTFDGVYDSKWYYFRRVRTEGKDQKIFTDSESKLLLYNKLLKRYGLFLVLIATLEVNAFQSLIKRLLSATFPSANGFGLAIVLSFLTLMVGMYLYMIISLIIKRDQLTRIVKSHL